MRWCLFGEGVCIGCWWDVVDGVDWGVVCVVVDVVIFLYVEGVVVE